jgi:hypothetical protein
MTDFNWQLPSSSEYYTERPSNGGGGRNSQAPGVSPNVKERVSHQPQREHSNNNRLSFSPNPSRQVANYTQAKSSVSKEKQLNENAKWSLLG